MGTKQNGGIQEDSSAGVLCSSWQHVLNNVAVPYGYSRLLVCQAITEVQQVSFDAVFLSSNLGVCQPGVFSNMKPKILPTLSAQIYW
jgi:hypothetical protein